MKQPRKERLDALCVFTDLYERVAQYIASVDPKYQDDLCIAFQVNPRYVNDCRKDKDRREDPKAVAAVGKS